MVDPYRFIVTESVVSSSQEDILKHIPGWKEKQPLSPLSQPLQRGLWRLCGSGGESDDDDDDDDGRIGKGDSNTTTFCVQEPVEWASPDTQLEKGGGEGDSYNPAFESDRSRSLSPPRAWDAFGDLFGSRIITQSQIGAENTASKGICMAHLVELGGDELLLGDEGVKKKKKEADRTIVVVDKGDVAPLLEAGVGLEQGIIPCGVVLHHQGINKGDGQELDPKPPALEDTDKRLNQFVVAPSLNGETSSAIVSALKLNTHCVERRNCDQKHAGSAEILAGNGFQQNSTRETPTFKGRVAEQLAFIFNKASNKNVSSNKHDMPVQVGPEEPEGEDALGRPRISSATVDAAPLSDVEKVRKRTAEEGDCAFASSTQKLKALKQANGEQEHSKVASEAKQWREKEVKQSQSTIQLEGAGVRDSEAKGLVSLRKSLGFQHKMLANRMEKTDTAEVVSGHSVDDKVSTLFPDSLMDVVMLVSGTLPPPRPDDPDFLSLVMSTGVSLPLPFRDCNGRFIGNKSS